MTKCKQTVLVAGAGIGGLTTALALAQRGFAVRLLEQTSAIQPIGYGIQLGPNAARACHTLGIHQRILEKSLVIEAISIRGAVDNQDFLSFEAGEKLSDHFDFPYAVIHRARLHEILLDACKATGKVDITTGVAIGSLEEVGEEIVVHAKDNFVATGSALIGADGIYSATRSSLFADRDAKPSGYAAYRCLFDLNDPTLPPELKSPKVILWAGAGFHVICYPLASGDVLNVVAVMKLDQGSTTIGPDAHAEIRRAGLVAHPTAKWMLDRMDLTRRWPISDLEPMRKWGQGRVVLIGDAAHATLQTLAQGAGMAMEDSLCLADLVERHDGNFVEAFSALPIARAARTARVQLESRALWETIHCDGVYADVRQYRFGRQSSEDVYACLQWLWGSEFPVAPARSVTSPVAAPALQVAEAR
jgi:salicylate hydroxylase